ncbi:hypothetical protein B484DRAFT_5315 [Ochromonadaceae sp. CCMP2298]|nr:hypothetical protein B484DRAFT_5315 [Ochromonadaceae sp. CCMP2298]
MNINEIKKQLQTWGVSTSSPGLNGDDRFEELKHRYELYRAKEAKVGTQQGTAAPSSEAFAVPSLNNLSIGEIRARLTALGENTSTPGVTGQERRSVLMRRLIDSICGADDDDDLDAISSAHDIVTPPPEAPEPTPAPVSPADAPFDVAANTAKISSMKKELKRLQNQRAIFVASRLAGNSQDEELRFCETKLGKLETELGYYKLMLQKGENKMNSANIKSDFLVLNKDATSFYTEALISKLDTYRSETKELIREHRVRIKQEGEEHPQYGVAAEDALKVLLSEANLASAGAKSGTSAKVSRARQRLNDVRDIDSRLEGGKEQGKQKNGDRVPSGGGAVHQGGGALSRGGEASV